MEEMVPDAPGREILATSTRRTKQADSAVAAKAEPAKVAINADGRRVYTLFVPGIPPSLNGGTRHWATRYRLGKDFREVTAWMALSIRPATPLPHARVTCTLVRTGGREKDIDNCYTSCKVIVDALRGILILDDSPAHIELLVRQENGSVRGVRVEVEELA